MSMSLRGRGTGRGGLASVSGISRTGFKSRYRPSNFKSTYKPSKPVFKGRSGLKPVTWYWKDDSVWKPYLARESASLERAYFDGLKTVKILSSKYEVNLTDMKQKNVSTGFLRDVSRKNYPGMPPPPLPSPGPEMITATPRTHDEIMYAIGWMKRQTSDNYHTFRTDIAGIKVHVQEVYVDLDDSL